MAHPRSWENYLCVFVRACVHLYKNMFGDVFVLKCSYWAILMLSKQLVLWKLTLESLIIRGSAIYQMGNNASSIPWNKNPYVCIIFSNCLPFASWTGTIFNKCTSTWSHHQELLGWMRACRVYEKNIFWNSQCCFVILHSSYRNVSAIQWYSCGSRRLSSSNFPTKFSI